MDIVPQDTCEGFSSGTQCSGRREFLVRASATAGGLILGLSSLPILAAETEGDDDGKRKVAELPTTQATAPMSDEVVLKLSEESPLSKVGGFTTIQTKIGKVIVARTAEASFAACSAVCTHKRGPIEYDMEGKQFFCPLHGSRFTLDGKVVRGPARQPLTSYPAESAVIVNVKSSS